MLYKRPQPPGHVKKWVFSQHFSYGEKSKSPILKQTANTAKSTCPHLRQLR